MVRWILPRALAVAAVWLVPAAAAAAERVESQTNLGNLGDAVEQVFNVLIIFLPGVATIYLAISGYRYMIAQGNPDLVEKAKKSLTYAALGVVLAYSSVAIVALVSGRLQFSFGP